MAGLFATADEARTLVQQRNLTAEIVELAPALAAQMDCTGEWEACAETHISVVEIVAPTKAWTAAEIDRVAEAQDGLPWVKYDKAAPRFMKALEAAPAACEIEARRIFLGSAGKLYDRSRMFAPVACPDGKQAWAPWRATRLESVVTRDDPAGTLHQVVLVECDSPTIEERPFQPKIPATMLADAGGCGG